VEAENTIVLAGAQNALFATSLCLFEPGDEVIVLDPMYVTYEATLRVSGADLVVAPPRRESGFRPDIAAIERAVTPRTRAILFANPSNPTGVVMSEAELSGIAEIAARHDLWVISDEVYAALTFDAPHISIAALPGMAERTVTVGSLSKSHAMTGWRCGWAIGPELLIRHMEKLSLSMLYGLPSFIQEGATAALTEGAAEMAAMRDIYRHRRDLVHSALGDVDGLAALKPEAGMFLLLDVRDTGLSASEWAWGLLREQGVAVLDATAFGPSAAGFVRISYAHPDDVLLEACSRIRRFTASTLRMTRQERASA
jgi:aspartate/methionine/tyrosine aminotransferase